MVQSLTLLSAALPLAAAWPGVMQHLDSHEKRQANPIYPTVPPPKFSSGRPNTGIQDLAPTFNAQDQFVNVSAGSGHEFVAPSSTDLRGECPGLNAAANHGFLPHNGILTIADTVNGLGEAYNMAPDLATVLAVIAIAISGDYLTQTWSIGGAYPSTTGLLGEPQGIVGTHNKYEGDASNVKGDAYLHGGNVGVFEMHKWNHMYNLAADGYTQDDAANQAYYTAQYSLLNNPYYFSAPFSGLVAPDAHNFVVNMMSNHSAANPGGYLSQEVLMSFFAVTGTPGHFVHHQGMERIPLNWYRRPSNNQFTTVATNADTVVNEAIYPGIVKFGGNLGKTNDFVGIDTGNLTGGVYSDASLFQGNNLACFFLEATQQALPDQLEPLIGTVADITNYLKTNLAPYITQLSCPQLSVFKSSLFAEYPGATYRAQGE